MAQIDELLMNNVGSPNAPTSVDDVVVTAPPRKPLNYNNEPDVEAVQAGIGGLPKPQGGGVNPGVWGLLPEKVQHGTLRNILGALGDAFLVQSGGEAQYGPRMERQQEGMAMAGYAQKPEAAIERMAGIGTPDSMKYAQGMMADTRQRDVSEMNAENQRLYREETLRLRDEQQKATAKSRDDNVLARIAPYAGGLLTQAKTPEEYQTAYKQADAMIKRINPQYSPLDIGALDPADWQPGIYQGVTGNSVLSSDDREASRNVSTANNIRSTSTSAANNRRSTATSAANNQRSTATSAANSQRSAAGRSSGGGSGLNPRNTAAKGALTLTPAQRQAAIQFKGKGGKPGTSANPLTPRSEAEFRNMPNGTAYIDTDGKIYTKGK